jgi:hypothetical protein
MSISAIRPGSSERLHLPDRDGVGAVFEFHTGLIPPAPFGANFPDLT